MFLQDHNETWTINTTNFFKQKDQSIFHKHDELLQTKTSNNFSQHLPLTLNFHKILWVKLLSSE